jgi:hypothetical protein
MVKFGVEKWCAQDYFRKLFLKHPEARCHFLYPGKGIVVFMRSKAMPLPLFLSNCPALTKGAYCIENQ